MTETALRCAEIYFWADELRLEYRCTQCCDKFPTHLEYVGHFLSDCINDFLPCLAIIPTEDVAGLTAQFSEFGFLIKQDDQKSAKDGLAQPLPDEMIDIASDDVDSDDMIKIETISRKPDNDFIENVLVPEGPAQIPPETVLQSVEFNMTNNKSTTIVDGKKCVVLAENVFETITDELMSTGDDVIHLDNAEHDPDDFAEPEPDETDAPAIEMDGESTPTADQAIAFPTLPKTANEFPQLGKSLRFTGQLLEELRQKALHKPADYEQPLDDSGAFIACDVCGARFGTRLAILRHMSQAHDGKSRKTRPATDKTAAYCCELCGKQYPTRAKLKAHSNTHTGERPYACRHPGCGRSFSSAFKRGAHMAAHSDARPYLCGQCPKSFKASKHLRTHERCAHSDARPYVCVECGMGFKLPATLRLHLLTHSGEKLFECAADACPKRFSTLAMSKRHFQRVHSGIKRYSRTVCVLCQQPYANIYKHMQTAHSDARPYVCETCGATFKVSDNYRRHLRTHTGERPYACDQCGKTFSEAGPYRSHMNLHSGERPYGCRVCERAFHSAHARSVHERDAHPERFEEEAGPKTGVVERPFECAEPECRRRFQTEWMLERHRSKRHSAEPKAEPSVHCDVCPKVFASAAGLQKHMLSAHTERPFVCDACGATFKVEETYQRHLRSHVKESKIQCALCDKTFATKSTLSWHMNIHNDLKPYKCRSCDLWYHSCPARCVHEKSVHNLNASESRALEGAGDSMGEELLVID